jgi:hypothetical protein
MKRFSLFRTILAGFTGLLIGVIFTALVELIVPATNVAWTLFPMCLATVFSGIAGYVVGARQKK